MKRFLSLFLATAGSAFATGFSLNEMSARGNALQGTLVGSTKDASAVYFNPANLTELETGHLYSMFGITLARPDYDTRVNGVVTDQDESVFPLPHVYLAGSLADRLYAGIGFYAEYGLGTCYEGRRAWPLSADSTKTKMECYTSVPTLAWKATESLSLGVGLRIMYLKLFSDRYIPAYASDFHLNVDDWALSYQAAVAWQASESIRLGLVYRAEAAFTEEGAASVLPLGVRTGVSGDITMPQSLSAGINWQTTDRLSLGFNATYTDWTSIDSLDMHFSSVLPDQMGPKHWKESMRYSVGAEYRFDEHWTGMLGYTFDEGCYDASCPDTMCPQGDRDQYGLGVLYADGPWSVALDYMLVIIHETDLDFGSVTAEFRNLRTDTIGLTYSRLF